jgi:hypothetical protein
MSNETAPSNAVNDAIERARQAAGQQAANPAGVPATAPAAGGQQVAGFAKPGTPLTMADMAGASINVDVWLKVNEMGMRVGDDLTPHDSMVVAIDMTEGKGFVPKLAIKYGNNPVTYKNSYDGVTCQGGGTWVDALEAAKRVNSNARPYRSVDLPMVLLDPLTKKDKSLIAAGTILGHSTSTTNWVHWESFYKECLEKGLMNKTVKVKLVHEARSKNSTNWGLIKFELIGEHAA